MPTVENVIFKFVYLGLSQVKVQYVVSETIGSYFKFPNHLLIKYNHVIIFVYFLKIKKEDNEKNLMLCKISKKKHKILVKSILFKLFND